MGNILVYYAGKMTTLEEGKTLTFKCADKKMKGNITLYFNMDGTCTFNGVTSIGKSGNKTSIKCAGKKMKTNIVISAIPYGYENPEEPTPIPVDSPIPIAVESEERMNEILSGATFEDVGGVYKYVGITTESYTYGDLYIITEE